MNTFRSQQGMSLIELLLSMLLFGVLFSMAIPAWQQVLAHHRHQRALQQLAQLITTARSLSLLHQATTTLCPSQTPPTCINDWDNALIIKGPDNHIWATRPALESSESLTLSAFPNNRYLQFNAMGLLKNSNGTFTYCHGAATPKPNQLVVSRSGRIRYQSNIAQCNTNKV